MTQNRVEGIKFVIYILKNPLTLLGWGSPIRVVEGGVGKVLFGVDICMEMVIEHIMGGSIFQMADC